MGAEAPEPPAQVCGTNWGSETGAPCLFLSECVGQQRPTCSLGTSPLGVTPCLGMTTGSVGVPYGLDAFF